MVRFACVAFTCCVAVALTACESDSKSSSATSSSTQSTTLNTIDPAAFQAAVEAAAKELKVPGAVVLLRTPQGEYTALVGTTELGQQAPPATSTHFRIASNTKTMTAALIVLLAQDGKLKFTEPISNYVQGVPNGENITIAELLKMRSGLYGYTEAPEMATAMDSDHAKVWTPQEVLDIAFAHPPSFAPNESYEYSNTNYALLGLVAEKVGERPLPEQLQDRLFTPLGLKHTLLPAPDAADLLPAPYSHGYMYGGSAYALADEPYPAEMQAAAEAGTLKPIDYTNQNSSYATAAGGAISTAEDLADWMKALVSGKVLDAEFQKQWVDSRQVEDPDNPGQEYGYGISYQRFGPNGAMFYHGGELPGFNSFMGHDLENVVTLVIWTNLTLSPGGKTTAQALLPIVLDQIYAGSALASTPTPTTTK